MKTYEWKKLTGGSFNMVQEDGTRKIIKKGDLFNAKESQIPKSFLGMFEKLDEVVEVKEPVEAPVVEEKPEEHTGDQYELNQRSAGYYDILHVITRNKMNDKSMRKKEATDFCEKLNESVRNK